MARLSLIQPKVLGVFSLVTSALLAGPGCIPKDKAISSSSLTAGRSYEGFNGLTKAETLGSDKVKLTWNASTDQSVVAYAIYDTSLFFTPKLLRTVPAPLTTVTLSGLIPQNFYNFRVRAANAQGKEDGNTNDLPAIPYGGAKAAEVIDGSSVKITYFAADTAEELHVYCRREDDPATLTLFSDGAKKKVIRGQALMNVTNPSVMLTAENGIEAGVTFQCRVAIQSSGFVDNNSQVVTFMPIGSPSKIVFKTQPGNGVAGGPLATLPVVEVQDAGSQTITAGPDASSYFRLTLADATDGAVLEGTSVEGCPVAPGTGEVCVKAVRGVVSLAGLNVNVKKAGVRRLKAVKLDGYALPDVTSNTFTINPGPADAAGSTMTLQYCQNAQSCTSTLGTKVVADALEFVKVKVALKDAYGNAVAANTTVKLKATDPATNSNSATGDPDDVQPTLGYKTAAGTGETDWFEIRATNVGGTESNPGRRTVYMDGLSSLQVVANLFKPGPASKLKFLQYPTTANAGAGALGTVTAAVTDAKGNVVVTDQDRAVTISVFQGPAFNITGTLQQSTNNGIVTYTDLGLSTITTPSNLYKLRVTAGGWNTDTDGITVSSSTPTKVAFTVYPGSAVPSSSLTALGTDPGCANFTVQLQDDSNNATGGGGATVAITMGSGQGTGVQFYTGSGCNTPMTGTSLVNGLPVLSFGGTTSSRPFSMRSTKSEEITLTATLAQRTAVRAVQFSPSKYKLVATSGLSEAKAGYCVGPFTLTTLGEDAASGATFSDTVFTFLTEEANGGTLAGAYTLHNTNACSDAAILSADGQGTPKLQVASGQSSVQFWLKSLYAQNVKVTVSPSVTGSLISSAPGNSGIVNILPSKISLTVGAATIGSYSAGANSYQLRANECGGPIQLELRDERPVTPVAVQVSSSKSLTLSAATVSGTSFFSDQSCANAVALGAITFPANQSSRSLYYRSTGSHASRAVSVSDPSTNAALKLTTSADLNLTAHPSNLGLYLPTGVTSAKTQVCAGPFTVRSVNASNSAVSVQASGGASLRVDVYSGLTGTTAYGAAGTVYTDGACSSVAPNVSGTPSLTIASGSSSTQFWFKGLWPESIRFKVSDRASGALRLQDNTATGHQSEQAFTLTAAMAWVGTGGGTEMTGAGTTSWSFNTNVKVPVGGRFAGFRSVAGLRYNSKARTGHYANKQYLHVLDRTNHRVVRIDATTGKNAGWIGLFRKQAGITQMGEGLPTTHPQYADRAICGTQSVGLSVRASMVTPAWCKNGVSIPSSNSGNSSTYYFSGYGALDNPMAITDDGTYLYVYSSDSARISKYDLSTGMFMGWIGRIVNSVATTPPASATAPDYRMFAGLTSTVYNSTANKYPDLDDTLGTSGCSTIANHDVTPVWCRGWNNTNDIRVSNNYYAYGIDTNTTQGTSITNRWTQSGHLLKHANGSLDKGQVAMTTAEYSYNGATRKYLYVGQRTGVQRYDIDTGRFMGWIGVVGDPTPVTSVPNLCPGCGHTSYATGATVNSPSGATYRRCWMYGYNSDNADSSYSVYGYGPVSCADLANPYDIPTSTHNCATTSPRSRLPGWCMGGTQYRDVITNINQANLSSPGIENPTGLFADVEDNYLYVAMATAATNANSYTTGAIARYRLDTGAYVDTFYPKGPTFFNGRPYAMVKRTEGSSKYLYVADGQRISRLLIPTTENGPTAPQRTWLGATSPATTGWQSGSTDDALPGLSGNSLFTLETLELDGDDKLVTGGMTTFPILKRWNPTTGAYEGASTLDAASPTTWSDDANALAGGHGFDDGSLFEPGQSVVSGDDLFVIDVKNARVKRIDRRTGSLKGIIGGVTSTPTGGMSASCASLVGATLAPGWCLGGAPHPFDFWAGATGAPFLSTLLIPVTTPGVLYQPVGITTDGVSIYVTDAGLHSILRYRVSDGLFIGWTGRKQTSTSFAGSSTQNTLAGLDITTGVAIASSTCSSLGAGQASNQWCRGGMTAAGANDGMLSGPRGIFYKQVSGVGYLYVYETGNGRVSRWNASTGAFEGWIGAFDINSSSANNNDLRFRTGPNSADYVYGTTTGGVLRVAGCKAIQRHNYWAGGDARYRIHVTSGWCKSAPITGTGAGLGSLTSRRWDSWLWGGWYNDSYSGGFGGTESLLSGSYSHTVSGDDDFLYISNLFNARIDRYTYSGQYAGSLNTDWYVSTNSTPEAYKWVRLNAGSGGQGYGLGNATPDSTQPFHEDVVAKLNDLAAQTASNPTNQKYVAAGSIPAFNGNSNGGVGSLNHRLGAVWVSGDAIYYAGRPSIVGTGTSLGSVSAQVVVKRDKRSGDLVGWKGQINQSAGSFTPDVCYRGTLADPALSGGDVTALRSGDVIDAWCQNKGETSTSSRWEESLSLGGFYDISFITADENFIYVTDAETHRVTRLPK